jgi:hypothetical protein
MVHLADDLRSHVPGRSTCILSVIWFYLPRYAQIGHPHVPLLVKDQVLGLEVAVDDLPRV